MKKALSIACILFLEASTTWAACTGSSPTWSCDFASVDNLVNHNTPAGFQRNDTVNVTAGSVSISSSLQLTKGVNLLGPGAANLTITWTGGTGINAELIDVEPDSTTIANGDNIKIDGFTLDANNIDVFTNIDIGTGGGINGTKAWCCIIITNNVIKNGGSTQGAGNAGIYTALGQIRGLIAKNTFDRIDMWIRTYGADDVGEWNNSAYYNFAFGSSDNLFAEDNTIKYSSSFTSADNNEGMTFSGQSGRLVMRFNTYDATNDNTVGGREHWDIHGFQNWNGSANSGQTGTMISEYYDNSMVNETGNPNVYRWMNFRGSWLMMFDNTFTGGSTPTIEVNQYDASSTGCPGMISPTVTPANPIVNNAYSFHNLVNGTLTPMTAGSIGNQCGTGENGAGSAGLAGGWWTQHATFTGATGIGRGIKSSMPATCTTGVGFWVTDEGSWNKKLAANTSGRFYKCTSTNTWTLYYTPYTYPHPLQGTAVPITLKSPGVF